MQRLGGEHGINAGQSRALDAAKAEFQQGRIEDARRSYQRILERNPRQSQALHFLGLLEYMDGNGELGMSLLQSALAESPGDYDTRKNLSNMLIALNRSDEAEPLCRGLAAERPADAGNHSNHSIALRKLGRHDEAVAAGRQAVAVAPESPVAWLALANALAGAAHFEQAVDGYERVIAINPTFSPAHDSLCRVLLQIEKSGVVSRFRMRRSRQAYRRWLQSVPGQPTATFMLDALERGRAPARMPDAEVKASFDACAADFDKHLRSLEYRAPQLVAAELARRLPAAAASLDMLDGGCGTGLSAPLLRPYARHLTGVDLSTAMLDRARTAGIYDKLVEGELGAFLEAHPESFDVCVIVDVLCYFGDLHAVLASAGRSLKADGLLAFSVEKSDRSGSHLHATGRYSHHAEHVRAALGAAGFVAIEQNDAGIRNEGSAPVIGLIFSARRQG